MATALGVLGVALVLIFALLAMALQLATSRLEEQDREPLPPAPHRPTWIAPDEKDAA